MVSLDFGIFCAILVIAGGEAIAHNRRRRTVPVDVECLDIPEVTTMLDSAILYMLGVVTGVFLVPAAGIIVAWVRGD